MSGRRSREGTARAPTKTDLLAVASYADVFARDGFSAGRWETKPGVLPMFMQSREVSDFVRAVYDHRVFLSFDWPTWQKAGERIASNDDVVAVADLETIRRLITVPLRQDRFSDGFLSAWVESPRAVCVLRRLGELAKAM